MSRAGYFIIGLVVGAGALGAMLFGYFEFGFAPVATSAAPMPFEKTLANADLKAHRKAGTATKPPIEANEANLLEGARIYRDSCAICHALPEIGKTDYQKGMFPVPPSLLEGKGVTNDPPGETFWVIQNGIRMTGMPSFSAAYSDEKLWQVTLLLAQASQLPASVQQLLRQPDAAPVTSSTAPTEPRTK